nr:hypothetical protein Iba_chr14fCG6750 [Ipomoea batatas]GME17574.1 hypothetical protein Iba_scaffold19037CG0010 [Ipomoea batatas]
MGFLQRIDFQTGLTEQGLVKGQVQEGYCQKDDFCCNSMCPMTSKRYSSASMLLIFSGILPIKLASFIQRCLSFLNWVKLGGISCGEKLFWLRTRTSRFKRLPICGGNEPFVNRTGLGLSMAVESEDEECEDAEVDWHG